MTAISQTLKSWTLSTNKNARADNFARVIHRVIILIDYTQFENPYIAEVFAVFQRKYNEYSNIIVSISGGADSDVVLDIATKIDVEKKIKYVFFDTGLEYRATKDHIKFLENKYNVAINIVKPKIPIPLANRKFGQPFLSKRISEMIERLQRHGFDWVDEPFDVLIKKYPKCKAALRWWCNDFGENSRYNIEYRKGLKEFMIANPPNFKISQKCCQCAKKDPAKDYSKLNECELSVNGIRKSEGGVRADAHKTCFDLPGKTPWAKYRPIFWFNNDIKTEYENLFNVTHSRCYTEYGLTRTGCAGCPFGRDFETELEIIKTYEPQLYNAVNKIFGNSYEYTRKYREFVKRGDFT